MKTIIAGSRTFDCDLITVGTIFKLGWNITEVVSGTARGADRCGEAWANINNVPIKRMPANWDRYGKSAGHRRNAEMAEYADQAIIFWDGVSPGTRSMIDLAKAKGLALHIEMV